MICVAGEMPTTADGLAASETVTLELAGTGCGSVTVALKLRLTASSGPSVARAITFCVGTISMALTIDLWVPRELPGITLRVNEGPDKPENTVKLPTGVLVPVSAVEVAGT